MPVNIKAKLIKKEQLINGLYKYSLEAKSITDTAKPGHFVEVRVADSVEPLLRRPISIYNMDKEKGILEIIFQVKGKGTEILANRREGEEIDLLGPLGYGTFSVKEKTNVAIIGGGIGTFPLYELAKQLQQVNTKVNTYIGFRSKDFVVLEKEFKEVSNRLVITTDDGSYAQSGFAIEKLKEDLKTQKIDAIYACGPLPMLKAVQALSIQENIPCQISLEEKMGCGIGACLGCAVKTAKSPKDAPEYWHVCKAGPVFNAQDVEI